MSLLAAMLPISAAVKVVSNLLPRRNATPEPANFDAVLQQTLGQRIVAQRDGDKDGALTLDEFTGGAARFAEWDSNHDGKLSAAEIDTGAKLTELWNQFDFDEDGVLTPHELGAAIDAFNSIDANQDLQVSRAEFFRAYQGADSA
jgi:Ca2+-binding EF-hand superfamily protein